MNLWRGAPLALALLAAGCGTPGRPSAPVPRHLVLVTIDTLRADRLGCYGSSAVATPHLDRLAREGAIAPEAAVQIPLTRPSHASILTGLLPSEHGLRDNVSPSLGKSVPTLAEILKGAGFRTAAFVSSIVLSSQSGLNRGFDTYGDAFEAGTDDARFLNSIQKRGDVTTAEAISWLEGQRDGRLFLWLHLYDPHDPYEPPEPYASRYAGRPYDGEVAWSDDLVGRLDEGLGRLGLKDQTLIVVTSDHGEGLGEHGETVHGFFVYQTTLRVPLLLRGPGIAAGTRLPVTARSVDLPPTVLELLGVSAPGAARFSGRSLASPLRGGAAPAEEASYAESLLPLLHYGWSDLRSLREGRWKYIQAPRPELYDLREDPGEQRDLLAAQPARAEALRAALARRLETEKATAAAGPSSSGVPPDLLEKLGALGYLGAGTPPQGAGTGADPKDKIEEFKILNRLVREGLLRLRAKDYAASADRFQQLLRRRVESFEVHYYLARALVGLGRHREAAKHFEAALDRLPGFAAAYLALAECRLALGDPARAVEALRRGEAAAPKDPRLHEREGLIWRKLDKPGEAIQAYQAAVALAPEDALLRVQLGESQRDGGDLVTAARTLREALALDPKPASYWNSLGMILGAGRRMAEAETAFREAVRRDEKNVEYAYNLGLALLRQGKNDDAAGFFRKALAIEPRFRAPRDRLAEMGRR